jgi:hypothetical protein
MVQLDLKGYSSLGPVVVKLNSSKPSTGEIEETQDATTGVLDVPPFADTGSADSFFDVFFEVTVGDRVLHNDRPVRMQTTILHKPPTPIDFYQNLFTQPVQLLDANGEPVGVSLVKEIHIPNPVIKIRRLPRLRAQLVLQTSQGLQRITLEGQGATNTFIDPTCKAVDSDEDDLDEVPIELEQLELRGVSPSLGEVVVRVRQNISSTGELEETVNVNPGKLDVRPCVQQGAGDSFFDVFFEIETALAGARAVDQGAGEVLHTATPLRLQTLVANQEPLDEAVYEFTFGGAISLLKEDGTPSGLQLVEGVQLSSVNLYLPVIEKPAPQ